MTKLTVEYVDNHSGNEMPRNGIFEPISMEDMAQMLYFNDFTHKSVFEFLGKMAEEPFKTGKWMRKELITKNKKDKNLMYLLKNIEDYGIPGVKEERGEEIIAKKFKHLDNKDVSDKDMIYMFGLLERNPYRFMRAFEKAYKKIDSTNPFEKTITPQIKTIITALETGDFSKGGKYYKKEEIEIPDNINVYNDMELATYFAKEMDSDNVKIFYTEDMQLYKRDRCTSVLGTIIKGGNKKILITSLTNPDMEHEGTVLGVYKSDRRTSDKKFAEKATGKNIKHISFKKEFKGKNQRGYKHPEDDYRDEDLNIAHTTKNDPDYLKPQGDYTDEDLEDQLTMKLNW